MLCNGSTKCSDHVVPGDVADSVQHPLLAVVLSLQTWHETECALVCIVT